MNVLITGLVLLALGGFGLYSGLQQMQQQKGQSGIGNQLKKGSTAITGFLGPLLLALIGLFVIYSWATGN